MIKAIFPFYDTLTGALLGRIRCVEHSAGYVQLVEAGYRYDLAEDAHSPTENWIGSPVEFVELAMTIPNQELEYHHGIDPSLSRTPPGKGQ
jgi:hypothetical protein